jgi:hypothetical protein
MIFRTAIGSPYLHREKRIRGKVLQCAMSWAKEVHVMIYRTWTKDPARGNTDQPFSPIPHHRACAAQDEL